MELPNEYIEQADDRLKAAGFFDKSLAELDLPEVNYAKNDERYPVAYEVHGNINAPNLILESTTFFTNLSNPHETLRVSAKQKALGDDFAIVAVDAYNPKAKFTDHERIQLANGSFSSLSQRQLSVLDSLDISDDQRLLSYGYSMAADIAIQTAYDTRLNPNRGTYQVDGVGAIEMARSTYRGPWAVGRAMMQSGKGLTENVLGSKMPALNEAWGITAETKAEKAVKGRVNVSVLGYLASGMSNNLAMVRGFGTEQSTLQVWDLLDKTELPVLIGRQTKSSVLVQSAIDLLTSHADTTNLTLLEEVNDHSADDNVRLAAARILYFASLAAA